MQIIGIDCGRHGAKAFTDGKKLFIPSVVGEYRVCNHNTHDLARAMAELYRDPLTCMGIKDRKLQYRPLDHFAFDIIIGKSIKFYLTVPSRYVDYAKTKVSSAWPKATIKPGMIADITGTSAAAHLVYKNHSFYAIHAARNDVRPLQAVLEASKDLHEGECTHIQIIARTGDRQQWEHEATAAYLDHKKGNPLPRSELSLSALFQQGPTMADGFCSEVYDFATEILGMEIQKKKEGNVILTKDFAKMVLRNQQGLTEGTVRKIREPIFETEIRIAVSVNDLERSRLLCRGIGGAFNELASNDQEFVIKPVRDAAALARAMASYKFPLYSTHSMKLSASEMGKLLQLPGAELQTDYPAIEQISTRETNLPAAITDPKGMHMGTVRRQGQDFPVHVPINNHDELCLPRIVIGGMGCGKTKGFGGNLIVNTVKKGFTAIAIDPARGELYAEAAAGLPPEKIIRIKFGEKPIALDWREVKHGTTARSRLASELIAFIETASDETGVQTMRYLRSAAKAVQGGRLTEIVELFTNAKYRQELIFGGNFPVSERETWITYDKMSDGKQTMIAGPVLNRLDVITGDDYLAQCLETSEGIDFVELIDSEPKAIIIDIPKADLGPEGVDVLAALVATKLDLAMVLRKTQHPVFVIQDEPHQYLRSARTWKAATVESRKWRFAYCWMFHSWEQIPRQLAEIIKSAGPHYHLYSSSKRTYKELAEELAPWTVEEAMETPTHSAINILRVGGHKCPVFMAKMAPPPSMQK